MTAKIIVDVKYVVADTTLHKLSPLYVTKVIRVYFYEMITFSWSFVI